MHFTRELLLILTAALLSSPPALGQDAAWRVGDLVARPGTRVSGELRIDDRPRSPGTVVPVTLVHGSRPGPTLAVIAGIHGYEYPGITALQQLRRELDPGDLSGRLILVHVRDGYFVAEGGVLGELFDLFGNPVATVRAPFAGVVNYVIGTPPVSEGEPVAMISRLHDGPEPGRSRPGNQPETGASAR